MGLKNWSKKLFDGENLVKIPDPPLEWISTGDFIIDTITGGGIPTGRITEIAGHFSSGKTTLALQTAKNVQKKGLGVIYVDAESALDTKYASEGLGVDIENEDLWQLLTFRSGKAVREIVADALETGNKNGLGLVVIDSVAAINPHDKEDAYDWRKDTGKIGDRATWWSKNIPLFTELAAKSGVPVIVINQIRKKLDFSWGGVVEDDVMGGNAVKFYKSLSIWLKAKKRETEKVKDALTGDEMNQGVRTQIEATTVKNKVYIPQQKGLTHILYGKGFDNYYTAMKIFRHHEVISREKNTQFIIDPSTDKPVKMGVSEKDAYNFLVSRPDIVSGLLKRIAPEIKYEYFQE